MQNTEFDKIRQEYDKVKSAVAIIAPFISSLLSRVRIVLTDAVITAGVSPNDVMAISPKFWNKLSWQGKAWLLAHETMHIAFRDIQREGNRNHEAWNWISDAVNNEMIKEFLKMPSEISEIAVTMDKLWDHYEPLLEAKKLTFEKFLAMSKEEIYRILPRIGCGGDEPPRCPNCGSRKIRIKKLDLENKKATFRCDDCGFEWTQDVELKGGTYGGGLGEGYPIPVDKIEGDLRKETFDGDVLQDGDPKVYEGNENRDEVWRNNIAVAYSLQKAAGTVPAGLKRMVDDLLAPKVDWRTLLRQSFRVGFGKITVSTWKRPSRKLDCFPGLNRYTYPTIWVLVDSSGSIDKKTLTQFMSEVYGMAGSSTVKVVIWDAEVYDVVEAKSRNEVVSRVLEKLKGGGGTVILPALKTTFERMKRGDFVVVLSDMDIADWDSDKTRNALSEVASKASIAVLCSSSKEVSAEGWRFIRLY